MKEKTIEVLDFKNVYVCVCTSCDQRFVLYALSQYGDGDYTYAGDYLVPQTSSKYCPYCGKKMEE